MPSLDSWDLAYYRKILKRRAHQLGMDPRIRVRENESDLANETLLRAHVSPEPFRGATEEERIAWLLKIQDNLYRELVAKYRTLMRDVGMERAAVEQALNESTAFWLQNLADDGASPSDQAVDREERELLERALATLPEWERAIMTLHHKDGMSMQEVADALGTTKGTVAGVVRRTTTLLAELVETLKRSPPPCAGAARDQPS